jgi:hypothetical protein
LQDAVPKKKEPLRERIPEICRGFILSVLQSTDNAFEKMHYPESGEKNIPKD